MLLNRSKVGTLMLVLATALTMSGCGGTMGSSTRCSGSQYEYTCSASYKSSEGQWSTELEVDRQHSGAVVSGTFTVASGSGTLSLVGEDSSQEFPISPDEPVEVTDLSLQAMDTPGTDSGEDQYVKLQVTADEKIEGFAAEYTYVTS